MLLIIIIVIGFLTMLVNQGVKAARQESGKAIQGHMNKAKETVTENKKWFEEPSPLESDKAAPSARNELRSDRLYSERTKMTPHTSNEYLPEHKQETFMKFKNKRRLAESFMVSEVFNKPRALNPHPRVESYKHGSKHK